ncbi:HsdM family class I SAM-dependent methyltransferase [Qipengyuania flava]|uniref:HsdM family class I SAM-dependent methyltransferase n=1 Tax=Qipengyuania flava TaxID=192812 RepID=UPI001C62D615|nr:N-6 DNA methylase [Qipengyuania flava]QYJ06268.1 SAM-dependent methyltransferase [Qipengyuania flava]
MSVSASSDRSKPSESANPVSKLDLITSLGRFQSVSAEKLRGGFYTPGIVTEWLCHWAISSSGDQVLEPSCGDGQFLVSAVRRLIELGASPLDLERQITGVEVNPEEAQKAMARILVDGVSQPQNVVRTTDFFAWHAKSPENKSFDAVVGNPPFIRYQNFPPKSRDRAMSLLGNAGLKPNKLTNIWVPFVVACIDLLKPGGRLAMVIPAELLQVTYAGQLRRYLTEAFEKTTIISCNELFFKDAEQEVLLLLASGRRKHISADVEGKVGLVQKKTLESIVGSDSSSLIKTVEFKSVCNDSEKWLKYFLSNSDIEFMRELRQSSVATSMAQFGSVEVGVVTGKNRWFVVDEATVQEFDLEEYVRPAIGRSVHLQGAILDSPDWAALSESGAKVHLLDFSLRPDGKINEGLRRYITMAEQKHWHQGYKCRIREPWYQVPSLWVPDGFVFRQIYDFPKMSLNRSRAIPTDTIHRLRVDGCEPADLIASAYTYLTGASAEIEGRSYGGGVLELEPSEARRLLVPSKLQLALPVEQIDQSLKQKKLDAVLEENSHLVLREGLGLSTGEIRKLKAIWTQLRERRNTRRGVSSN